MALSLSYPFFKKKMNTLLLMVEQLYTTRNERESDLGPILKSYPFAFSCAHPSLGPKIDVSAKAILFADDSG